ncbi:MAG: nucleoside triphosphate pyrophosphatase [Anaerolineae bacterium]
MRPAPDYLILASTSPRRRQFLEQLGLPFTVIAPGSASGDTEIDETPLPNEAPSEMVQRLSRDKAQAVLRALPALFPQVNRYANVAIIAADTSVVLRDRILGKPATPAEAAAMLRALRDEPHLVYSGLTVALAHPPARLATRLHQSQVWMRPYTNADIEAYVATGSPLDKAGAYGIQDDDFAPVARLEGCFASVMGFPVADLRMALADLGLALPHVAPLCRRLTGQPCCADH